MKFIKNLFKKENKECKSVEKDRKEEKKSCSCSFDLEKEIEKAKKK